MMAVDITTEPSFTQGKPELLFEGQYVSLGAHAEYDVTPDGEGFLILPKLSSVLLVENPVKC